jgi:hypothetical protein
LDKKTPAEAKSVELSVPVRFITAWQRGHFTQA